MKSTFGANELERLLMSAASDPAERPQFISHLLQSEVYVLGQSSGRSLWGRALLKKGENVELLNLEDKDGLFIPFFTSESALRIALDVLRDVDGRFVQMNCRSLFELVGPSRFVLNPHAPYGRTFLPSEIESYLKNAEPGKKFPIVGDGQSVLVGEPREVPDGFLAMLARFFVQRPVIEAAHFGWIQYANGQAGYFLSIIAADHDAALDGFVSLGVGEFVGKNTLDVAVVQPGGNNMLATVPPFYIRGAQVDVMER